MSALSMGAEDGLGGTWAQAPLTDVHHAYLRAVKAPRPTMGAGARTISRNRMDERLPPNGHAATPGLNPRDALDILDIRTGKPGGASELATRTDAGPDVLHYLA